MNVTFFDSAAEFRRWLEDHHDSATEIWVGFWKKGAGREGLAYPAAVDIALCFGWIDGIRKRVDDTSYTNRFTSRKAGSTWSAVNVQRVGELAQLGLMHPAGLKAFEARDEAKTRLYSYEAESRMLESDYEQRFRANEPAWQFFQAQAPSYRRAASWWVMSAKKPETREKRLAQLIADSAQGRRLAHLSRPGSG